MKVLYLTEREGYRADTHKYTVTKAVNTVRHAIGEILSRNIVVEYCSLPDWKIIVTKAGV